MGKKYHKTWDFNSKFFPVTAASQKQVFPLSIIR